MKSNYFKVCIIGCILFLFIGNLAVPKLNGNIIVDCNELFIQQNQKEYSYFENNYQDEIDNFDITMCINHNFADINQTLDLAVTNYHTSDVTVLIGDGTGVFGEKNNFSVLCCPCAIIAKDFNKDKILDLAVTNQFAVEGYISIFFGDGYGKFENRTDYQVGDNPSGIASGYFNEDEFLDLAVANFNGFEISVLLGTEDGRFDNRKDIPVGNKPIGITSNYFNKDEHLDLAVVNYGDDDISILFGDGKGGFKNRTDYSVMESPYRIVTEDFNQDGNYDLAVTNQGQHSISVLFGDNDGSFGNRINWQVRKGPEDIITEDFNQDGNYDLAVSNTGANSIQIFFGDGKGKFTTHKTYIVGGVPKGLFSEDFNNDDNLDIIVANQLDDTISILFGNGIGDFENRTDYYVGISPYHPVAGDFTIIRDNQPPYLPTIDGPKSGKVKEEYLYNFVATDPEKYDLKYEIWWDEENNEITEFYKSGELVQIAHTWREQGKYNIKAKAIDIYGSESDWATLTVTVPKIKAINTPLFLQKIFQYFSFFDVFIKTFCKKI